jgi:hypothetical protein
MNDWSDEPTNNVIGREVETKDGKQVDRLLYASNNLDKARQIFTTAIKHRPRIRLTIRQRTQVLEQWPRRETLL